MTICDLGSDQEDELGCRFVNSVVRVLDDRVRVSRKRSQTRSRVWKAASMNLLKPKGKSISEEHLDASVRDFDDSVQNPEVSDEPNHRRRFRLLPGGQSPGAPDDRERVT